MMCTAATHSHCQLDENPLTHPSPDPCIHTPINPLFADAHSFTSCFLPRCFPLAPPHLPPVGAGGRASPLISSWNKQPGKHHETFKGGCAASFPLICAGKSGEKTKQKKQLPMLTGISRVSPTCFLYGGIQTCSIKFTYTHNGLCKKENIAWLSWFEMLRSKPCPWKIQRGILLFFFF